MLPHNLNKKFQISENVIHKYGTCWFGRGDFKQNIIV